MMPTPAIQPRTGTPLIDLLQRPLEGKLYQIVCVCGMMGQRARKTAQPGQ